MCADVKTVHIATAARGRSPMSATAAWPAGSEARLDRGGKAAVEALRKRLREARVRVAVDAFTERRARRARDTTSRAAA
jgi:hypothetical protein